MLLETDVDEADLGVEQEKLDPTVMVCDTCGLCQSEGRGEEGRREQESSKNIREKRKKWKKKKHVSVVACGWR